MTFPRSGPGAVRPERAKRLARVAAAALASAALACGEGGPPPDVVLVTIDTLRADHLSFYGYDRETTPHLSSWVAEATVFDGAYTPLPLTDPALSSLFSGLHPARHGVRHAAERLGREVRTLAQVLHARGYATAAFASRAGIVERSNLGRGFDVVDFVGGEYDDPSFTDEQRAAERWQRRAKSVTEAALAWLREPPPEPFFVWIHYFDPHAYYDPPAPFRDRFAEGVTPEPADGLRAWWGAPSDVAVTTARYDEEILAVDAELARVVEELARQGRFDRALFVLTADHGESLGEHGHLDHGEWLYHEQIRVPLVVRMPGRVPSGLRVPDLVRLYDVAPTVLDLVGATGPEVDAFERAIDGESFAPLFDGGAIAPRRIFVESEKCPKPGDRALAPGMVCDPPGVAGKLRAVFDGRYKLIVTPMKEGPTTELYDLRADPRETTDLSAREPERVAALEAEIAAYWSGEKVQSTVDPELAEELKALGYTE